MTAGSIQQDLKERVRDASDIVSVVGEHIALKPRGREYVGLCPFHDDHKPSMAVIPHKQIFHCHPCGTGGDVFSFVQKYHGMTFPEALEFLGQRAGIEIRSEAPARSRTGEGPTVDRAELRRANALASDFFRAILRHEAHGAECRGFLERRGIPAEMIERFALGASPDRSDGLLATIRGKRLDEAHFLAADLVRTSERGGDLYDTFRGRLMFPIHDGTGRIVLGFGARRVDSESERKYINSSATELFDKKRVLYGLSQASRAIRRESVAIVCEGYMDVIACHQFGVENVVGVLGTALTTDHARALKRLCDRIVLLFDGDQAGLRAVNSAIEVLFAEDMDVRIATLSEWTDAKDPDELVRRSGGVETLRRAIERATDLLRFRLRALAERAGDAGPGALHGAITEELRSLHGLGLDRVTPSKRHVVLAALAEAIQDECGAGFEPRALKSLLTDIRRAADRRPSGITRSESLGPARRRQPTWREHLLGCLLNDPSLWLSLATEDHALLDPEGFEDTRVAQVAETTRRLAGSEGGASLQRVVGALEMEAAEVAVWLSEHVDRETESNRDRLHEHWRQTLRAVRAADLARARPGAAEDTWEDRMARLRTESTTEALPAGRTPDNRLYNRVLPGVARRG